MESGNLSCVGQCCVGADYLPSVAISRQLFLDHTPKPSPSLCLPPHQSRVSKTQYTKASKIPLEPNLWKTTPLHHYTTTPAWGHGTPSYWNLYHLVDQQQPSIANPSVREPRHRCLATIKSSTTSCFRLHQTAFLLPDPDPDLPLIKDKHMPIIETPPLVPPRVQR
jgi:hypothetical protein